MGSTHYVQFDPTVIEWAWQIDLLFYLQRYESSNLKRVAGNVYCTREHDSFLSPFNYHISFKFSKCKKHSSYKLSGRGIIHKPHI